MSHPSRHRSGPSPIKGTGALTTNDTVIDDVSNPQSSREQEIEATRKLLADAQTLLDQVDNSRTMRMLAKRDYPTFDRNEFSVGPVLGTGGFGIVFEVESFKLKPRCATTKEVDKKECADGKNVHKQSSGDLSMDCVNDENSTDIDKDTNEKSAINGYTEDGNHSESKDEQLSSNDTGKVASNDEIKPRGSIVAFAEKYPSENAASNTNWMSEIEDGLEDDTHYHVDHARQFMADNVRRNGDARYAFKRLHREMRELDRTRGMIDLAIEAKFLSVLWHPNIGKLPDYNHSTNECMIISNHALLQQ
jgi:hypothetical protein